MYLGNLAFAFAFFIFRGVFYGGGTSHDYDDTSLATTITKAIHDKQLFSFLISVLLHFVLHH